MKITGLTDEAKMKVEMEKAASAKAAAMVGKFEPSTIVQTKLNIPAAPSSNKLIHDTIFEPEGTEENRQDDAFNYPYGLTEGRDPLRQVSGKYFTYKKSGDVVFLNPYLGEVHPSVNSPVKIYFGPPKLIEGEIWPEYEQELIITPDINWLYKNFVEKYMTQKVGELEGQIKQIIEQGHDQSIIQQNLNTALYAEPTEGNPFSGGIVKQVKGIITDWWLEIMKTPGSTGKGCEGLITIAQRELDESEVCTPWISLDTIFVDHVLEVSKPIESKVSSAVQPILNVKLPYFSLNSEYNFYIKTYEKLLERFKGKSTPNQLVENILPNIYPFISSFVPDQLTGEKSDFLKYQLLISLNGLYKKYNTDALRITKKDILEGNNLKKPPSSAKQYFSGWSYYLSNHLVNSTEQTLARLAPVKEKYNNILFPMYHTEILQEYNDHKFMFPMYNELDFSTGVQNILGDTLRQTKLANGFMYFYTIFSRSPSQIQNVVGSSTDEQKLLIESFAAANLTKNQEFLLIQKDLKVEESTTEQGDLRVSTEMNIGMEKFQTTELEAFLALLGLDKLFESEGSQISNLNLTTQQFEAVEELSREVKDVFGQNTTFITVDDNDEYVYSKPDINMQKNILSTIFVGKLRQMAKQKLRTFTDIMRGRSNYSEAMMYIVEKQVVQMGAGGGGGNFKTIQTYYFLNTSKVDVLKFIDTQVNYDVNYQYVISAIVLSLGSSYYYQNPQRLTEATAEFIQQIDSKGKVVAVSVNDSIKQIEQYTDEMQKDKRAEGVGQAVPMVPRGRDKSARKLHSPGQPGSQPRTVVGADGKGNYDLRAGNSVEQTAEEKARMLGLNSGNAFAGAAKIGAQQKGEIEFVDQPNILDIFDPEAEFDDAFKTHQHIREGNDIGANSLSIRVKVRKKPNYKIIRVPVAVTQGRVLDKPPIFPDVLITPYKGINNKLLINLNQNVGEYFMKPVFFDDNDKEQYENQLAAQKVSYLKSVKDPAIEYKGDDTIGKDGHFEVYRMDRKPQSYQDFQGRLMTKIRGYHEMEVGHMESNSVSLQDDILPNRKYYYTFRAVDVHGHKSNPSPVFQVEMVDDNGTVYMLQEIIEMEPPNIKETSKSAKKYIQIKPNFEQSILNLKHNEKFDSVFDEHVPQFIELGGMPTPIWGKKFKIRITSKSSGKQVDLNVTFNRTDSKELRRIIDATYAENSSEE
jgi:hypothetical protein